MSKARDIADRKLDGDDLTLGDNDKAIFGAGSDLQIYHDGGNSWIKDTGGGNLRISASSYIQLQNDAGTQTMALFNDNGNVSLRYAGAEKLATTSTGVDVTGTVTADGLTVDGSGVAAELRGNNGSASYNNKLRFTDTDSAMSTGQSVGRIEFYTSDTSSAGVAGYIDTYGYNSGAVDLLLGTGTGGNATERMRIDSSGNFLVGRDSPFVSGSHAFQSGDNATLDIYCPSTATGRNIVNIRSNVGGTADICAAIEANGDFRSDSNSYGSNSDSRLKQDIVDANSQLDDIKALDFKNYRLIKQVEVLGEDAPVMLGVIAQDLEAAGMSGLVSDGETIYWTQEDADSDEGLPDGVQVGDVREESRKAVKYSVLYMKAVKALQETIQIVDEQQAVIDSLLSRVEALEANG